ncbi:hypothetical protein [Bifidobacterium sp. ESL0790]|uniref:hypothetical protein n=1 Tax=Bifidobacterium sp. ESL0790 TaxID=2983233 RepID=UPI0023F76F49|nr:hypothetical protein [Bifidobacterium sp. ESL0790]WEV71728.1 hypothetical protein OZY47_04490 [Bifidobacterium sp. ESL0790]
MPWWGWIIVAVVVLAVFACGVAYAGIHAVRAAKSASGTVNNIQHYLGAMQGDDNHHGSKVPRPSFTEPLETASRRYSKAHEGVVTRDARKRQRHEGKWALWRDNPVPGSVAADKTGASSSNGTTQSSNAGSDASQANGVVNSNSNSGAGTGAGSNGNSGQPTNSLADTI